MVGSLEKLLLCYFYYSVAVKLVTGSEAAIEPGAHRKREGTVTFAMNISLLGGIE